jgi:hypothetical protein
VKKAPDWIKVIAAFVLMLSCATVHPQARETDNPEAQSGATRAMSIGPQQAALGALLGTWDVDIVLGDGTKPAQTSKGKAEYYWVVQDRWMGCHLTGQMLGFPYEEFTILGYDSYARNLVEVAVESVDNSMLLSRGTSSEPGQPATALYGDLDEYTSGVLRRPYKVLMQNLGPNRHATVIYGFDDAGKEIRKVTFTFHRNT